MNSGIPDPNSFKHSWLTTIFNNWCLKYPAIFKNYDSLINSVQTDVGKAKPSSHQQAIDLIYKVLQALRNSIGEKYLVDELLNETKKFFKKYGFEETYGVLKVDLVPKLEDIESWFLNSRNNLPKLFAKLYDSQENFLAEGYTGEEITLSQPIERDSEVVVRLYALDEKGRYLKDWRPLLRRSGNEFRVKVLNSNIKISIPVNHEEKSIVNLTTKFEDLEISKELKKELGNEKFKKIIFNEEKPEISGVSFSDYLQWDKEKVMALFGDSNGNPLKLYKHQLEALELLGRFDSDKGNPKRVAMILASGMASGKTEVAVLYLLKLLKTIFNDTNLKGGGHIVVVYPTIELLRNQYDRWKMYFDGAYDLNYLTNRVEVLMIYGSQDKRKLRINEERIKRSPCVVLTTASTLVNWANNLDKVLNTIPYAVVLDEIHFYTAFDLSLLIEFLNFVIRKYGKGLRRILMFSATVGELNELAKDIEKYLHVNETKFITGKSFQGRKVMYVIDLSEKAENEQEYYIDKIIEEYTEKGFKDKTLIFARDRGEAESIRRRNRGEFSEISNLHIGDMSESERKRVVEEFKSGKRPVMITVKTLEVGIDIGDVSRVIHLGLPPSLNDFMQREGRMGRKGQECESIVILRNSLEVKNFNEWIGKKWIDIRNMSRLVFNPDSEIIKKVREKYESKGSNVRFPKEIEIRALKGNRIERFKIPCKIYAGATRIPVYLTRDTFEKEGKGKKIKEVWIRDVIFRYLPYSIRTWNEKRYIVKDILVENAGKSEGARKRKPKLKKVVIGKINENEFNIKAIHRTTSYVETHITPSLENSPYRTIIVHYEPISTHHIGRSKKLVAGDKPGEYKEIPYYYIIRSFPVRDDIRKALMELSMDFTRGFMLDLKIPREIASSIPSTLLLESKSDIQPELYIESILNLFRISIEHYIHLSVHLLLNQIVKKERFNPRELDHFIKISIDKDEELKEELRKILNKSINENEKYKNFLESVLPKLSITVVIGNKADLLKSFDFNSIKVEEVEKLSEKELKPLLIFPRCFERASLFDDNLLARNMIVHLTKLLLDRLKDASNKIKTY